MMKNRSGICLEGMKKTIKTHRVAKIFLDAELPWFLVISLDQ